MASPECYLDDDIETPDMDAERLRRSHTRYLQHTNEAVLKMFEKNIADNSRVRGAQVTGLVKEFFDRQLNNLDAMLERWKDPRHLETLLAEYLWCFDAMLCNGNIKKAADENRFTFELILRNDKRFQSHHGQTCIEPAATELRRPTNVKVFIYIYESHDQDKKGQLQDYIGTIAHELIHAVYCFYVCPCRNCAWENAGGDLAGHGEYWHKEAKMISDFLSNQLELNVGMGRATTMAIDMIHGYRPSEEFLDSLKLNHTALRRNLARANSELEGFVDKMLKNIERQREYEAQAGSTSSGPIVDGSSKGST